MCLGCPFRVDADGCCSSGDVECDSLLGTVGFSSLMRRAANGGASLLELLPAVLYDDAFVVLADALSLQIVGES